MAEIHSLAGDCRARQIDKPVQGVIEVLEEALAEARSGVLRQVALVGIRADTDFMTWLAGDGKILVLLGAVAKLQHTISSRAGEVP